MVWAFMVYAMASSMYLGLIPEASWKLEANFFRKSQIPSKPSFILARDKQENENANQLPIYPPVARNLYKVDAGVMKAHPFVGYDQIVDRGWIIAAHEI